MGRRRTPQGSQVVAAFEGRDEPSRAALIGHGGEFGGCPFKVRFEKIERRQGIGRMGVEARRNQQHIGAECAHRTGPSAPISLTCSRNWDK